MSEIMRSGKNFIGYEYKEVVVSDDKASMYIDGYSNFGWELDENFSYDNTVRIKQGQVKKHMTKIRLKRDRKIINKMELTRLQQHFEACMNEIDILDRSKTLFATMISILVGLVGTAFMALSVFAITSETPHIILCIIFAIPGFIGWAAPCIVYRILLKSRTEKIMPLVENKYDEAFEICEKGNKLLLK